jgi:pimeloyl-ACP methyl ester carboxylesterase
VLGAALLAACVSTGPPEQGSARHPLPPEAAARYAVPPRVDEELLVPIGARDGIAGYRGVLRGADERVHFHLLLPRRSGAPLVICLPILAGGEELMWMIALDLARRGFAVAWSLRAAGAFRPPQTPHDIEELFRRTIVHNRMLLAWAKQVPEIDGGRSALLGLSTGGFVGTALLALEPDLAGGALCLSGADIPGIVLCTAESRVVAWRGWRRREAGADLGELARELGAALRSDPYHLAPHVGASRVLLVHALLDRVVPRRYQDLLWERLGRPQRLTLLHLGHYSAALALTRILDEVEAFYRRRFAAVSALAR